MRKTIKLCVETCRPSSLVDRAAALQAEGRGFEPQPGRSFFPSPLILIVSSVAGGVKPYLHDMF